MKKKILLSYAKGITHSPSCLLCEDGDLDECVNLEVKNGELVPMEMPVKLGFSLDEGEKLLLVHNTKTDDKNYVTITDGILRIFEVVGDTKKYFDFTLNCGEVKSIQFLGNSIVVYTADSPHYILYSNGAYKSLGSKLPEVGISFDLLGDYVMSDIFKFKTPEGDSFADEDYQEGVCKELIPEVNKFIEENSISKGKFMFPFFVRYALRLFDGTHVMHSAPILMLPSTNISPFVASYSDWRDLYNKEFEAQIGAFIAQLEATISYMSGSLSEWSDVVSSLDIFVSRQIYTYDQNGAKFGNSTLGGSKFIGKYNNRHSTIWDGYSLMSSKVTMSAGENEYLYRWYIPSRDIEDINEDITSTSLFYKYTSIAISDISVGKEMPLNGSLSALEVGESLSDDYMTHDVFIPESSFVYNGRLNISSVYRQLYKGFPMQCLTQMVKYATQDGFDYNLLFGTYDIYTFIKSPNGGFDVIVKSDTSTHGSLYGAFLFYPDSDAYKMVIVDKVNDRYAQVSLTEHSLLNGAFAFIGFQPLTFYNGDMNLSTTENVEYQPNKLYVSNVNNIFHFPLEGIYTVGSDKIIGVGAVTRPISQGQFGEFPLIVFCSDGNYAMRVDEQGFYASISPVQEDVVLGSDKITAMENSLMIITKKGLMLTSGGDIHKIASQMDGGVLEVSSLSGVSTSISEFETLVGRSSDKTGFLTYVYGSKMAFDYASNRLLVYNQNKPYAYMYNFDNDTASKIVINGGKRIVSSVLDYPDTIIQDESGSLYSLYTKEDVSMTAIRQHGFALTRPLKLGAALHMKSISQILHQSSNCGNGSFVKYSLYGSNDNTNYYRMSSRFGKPYKFYRVAIYTYLLPKESLSGTVLSVEERRTHKLR